MMIAQTEPIWNPAAWPEFIRAVGIPGFFALAFFAALAYVWYKQQKGPESNAAQLRIMRLAARNSNDRHAQLLNILRQIATMGVWCAGKSSLSENDRNVLDAKLAALMQTIDAPPRLDAQLELDEDDTR